jgi:hypothetical protein
MDGGELMSEPQVPEHLRPIGPRTQDDAQAAGMPPRAVVAAGDAGERLEPFSATHERPALPS